MKHKTKTKQPNGGGASQQDYVVVGVDPGSSETGITTLKNNQILSAYNVKKSEIFDIIYQYKEVGVKTRVIIEDIVPYHAQISPFTIETCKIIGMLEYRLKTSRIAYSTVSRNDIRKWVFDSFPSIAIPLINKKIRERGITTKSGNFYKASHTRVDDVVVRAAMLYRWGLPERNNEYGISRHSWQSLSLATYKIDVLDKD